MSKSKQNEKEENFDLEEILPEKLSNASLVKTEVFEIMQEDLDYLLPEPPQMNVSVPEQKEEKCLISDDQYLDVLGEILTNIRDDRKQVSDYLDNIAEMVINGGDATTASKEALVNLVKIKTDLQDKMLKALDQMGRLKSKNYYAGSGAHMNAVQQNNYNISKAEDLNRKELIRAINHAKKEKK